ncbi:FAD-binding oxidoreductase [Sphaerisporangium corydalis]|uniref:FAD-binding oxidoreductase n=1 Tax=Sphaerisporangium corydalis TaxID=1441875 RepID=A0ABV9EFF2_9ACTN|nr:FAD-binding oxidoreductase [Sphaerisporangium corydalis]
MTQHAHRHQPARDTGPGEGARAAVRRLRRDFAGELRLPGDPGHDAGRCQGHCTAGPRPAIVAEASGPADVRAAVVAARKHTLPLAVRATGHGTHVPAGDGILLRTSAMATVLVDPARRVARVGPGARWGQVIAAAAPFGLAPLSASDPTVGVTGSTLGGGVGWLSREYGFAADNVLRAEVVTADGRHVTASPDRHPSLFWALRGGGGNFGVVTSLEFRLHPVSQVYAGTAYFPAERAAGTLALYRDWIAGAPDELSTAVLLTPLPAAAQVPGPLRGRRVLAIRALYTGEAAEAERLLRPLRQAAGPALWEAMGPASSAATAMGGIRCRQAEFFDHLPDAVIEAITSGTLVPVEVRHWAGAMARPRPGAGPVGHRTVPLSVTPGARAPELEAVLRAHATGVAFLNFLSDPTRTPSAYTVGDYRRLREVKAAYDPDNVFRRNLNIPPAP